MNKRVRVGIVGAGVCGLLAIKQFLDEGLEPVCLERTQDICGLWRYEEGNEKNPDKASVMKTTIINTSKEMMAYSDYPPPADFPNYMPHYDVQSYVRMYADKFNLMPYIRFDTEVSSIRWDSDSGRDGPWIVSTKNNLTKEEKEERFDALAICTGHHATIHMPKFKGIERYPALKRHSRDVRVPSADCFHGKNVLVIGIGNSGGDIAVEISRVARKVFLSTRRGTWIFKRLGSGGMPSDYQHFRRSNNMLANLVGSRLLNKYVQRQLQQYVDHDFFNIRPNFAPLQQHPMVNDYLPSQLLSGLVEMRSNVKSFEYDEHSKKKMVIFEDGSVVEDIDVVIFATGYIYGFPFLPTEIVNIQENINPFYKYVFPFDLPSDTFDLRQRQKISHSLAFVGFIQPVGAVQPIAELQCRWIAQIFRGIKTLPSYEVMLKDRNDKRRAIESAYVKSLRHTMQVFLLPYSDELAEKVGCMPRWFYLFFTDWKLLWALLTGPSLPYQYRLFGSNQWPEARNTILTVAHRMRQHLLTRSDVVVAKT